MLDSNRAHLDGHMLAYGMSADPTSRVYLMVFDMPEGTFLSMPWKQSGELLVSTSREMNDVAEASANLLRRLGCEKVYVSLNDQGKQKGHGKTARERLADAQAQIAESGQMVQAAAAELEKVRLASATEIARITEEKARERGVYESRLDLLQQDLRRAVEESGRYIGQFRQAELDKHSAERAAGLVHELLGELAEGIKGIGIFNFRKKRDELSKRIQAYRKMK